MKFAVNVVVAFVSFGSITAGAFATDLLVPSEYSSMQGAINAAVDGDTVIVAPGTYNETMSISDKSITIRSSGGAAATKIDRVNGGGTIFNVYGSTEKQVTIEGFTITRWEISTYMVTSNGPTVVMRNDRCLQGGYGVYLTGGADLTVENNDWVLIGSYNYSDRNPIRGEGDSAIIVRGTTFQGLRGYYGGVIRATTNDTVVIEDTRMTGCSSNYYGGCVFAESNATVSMARVTVENCRAENERGGVVRASSGAVTITDSTFKNIYSYGTGSFVYSESGSISVSGSTISDSNSSPYEDGNYGGFIHIANAPLLVEDCVFRNLFSRSRARWGGIIGSRSGSSYPMTIVRTRFEDCSAFDPYNTYHGRIIHSYYRPLIVQDCDFVGSRSTYSSSENTYRGGAIHIDGGTFTITGSLFDRQTAYDRGGAIYAQGPSTGTIDGCTFTGCTSQNNPAIGYEAIGFENNDAGSWSISNSHFIGSGIHNYGTRPMNVAASTFVRDPALANATVYSPSAPASFSQSLFKNTGGSFSLTFGDSGYVLLSACSFCRSPSQEIYQYYIEKVPCIFNADCESDCDADGLPDDYEITAGLDSDCNANGTPDSCEFPAGGTPDCDRNGIYDVCDIAGGAPDCNLNGVLDSCEADCDNDGIPNACEITGGAPDCNTNGIPDTCEPDCNGDGVIDVCEITSGAPDCNTNGIPDSCDITLNGSLDFNLDGIIDSCQPTMQFAGLQLEIVPIVNRGTDDLFPAGAVCYRLYATTVNTNTAVIGMYGNSANPMVINAVGGFWQSPYGGDLAAEIPCDLSSALPTAKYDSWFTIGLPCAAANLAQNGSLDLTGFNSGGGINDNDGIIFVTPNAPQGIAGNSKRVLLAQLTTQSAVFPTGFVDILGRAGGSTASWIASHQQIPTPALVDCNNNGEHDAFDIALGVSLDCDQSGVPDTCEYPSASTDCNSNGIADLCDTISGFSSDKNGNHVPDECECSGDVDGNGYTDVDDLIDVLVAWGDTSYGPADLNQDGIVDSQDLLLVMVGWGNCL
jgi:hypothetical protein